MGDLTQAEYDKAVRQIAGLQPGATMGETVAALMVLNNQRVSLAGWQEAVSLALGVPLDLDADRARNEVKRRERNAEQSHSSAWNNARRSMARDMHAALKLHAGNPAAAVAAVSLIALGVLAEVANG